MAHLGDEVARLSVALESAQRTEKWHRRFLILLAFVAVVSGAGTIRVYMQQDDIREAARASAKTIATLEDCLLPTGKCYQRSVEMGRQGTTRSMKFNACMLIQLPENRSKTTANSCARFAFPEIPDLDLYENGG